MPTIGQDLVKLKKLKDEAAELNARATTAKARKDEWERHCYSRMDAEEVKSTSTRGSLYVATATTMANVQDRDAFLAWAKENAPELVIEKELGKELNALVRACLDDGKPLPEGVGFFIREGVSVRKASS